MRKRDFGFHMAPGAVPEWCPSVTILVWCAVAGAMLAIVYRLVLP